MAAPLGELDRARALRMVKAAKQAQAQHRLACQAPGCSDGHVLCGFESGSHLADHLLSDDAAGEWISATTGDVRAGPDLRRVATAAELAEGGVEAASDTVAVHVRAESLLGELRAAACAAGPPSDDAAVAEGPSEEGDAAEAAAAMPSAAAAAAAASTRSARGVPRHRERLAGDAPDAIARPQADNRPPPGTGLTGLVNLGNTCFLNAGLQALMCVPHFARSFTELYQTSSAATHSHKRTILRAMESLVCACASTELDTQSPRDVLGTLRSVNQMFSGYHQHDSHEAMRFILNDIHETAAQRENNWGARHEHFVGPPPAETAGPASAAAGDAAGAAAGAGAASDDRGDIATVPSSRRSPLLAAATKDAGAAATASSVVPGRAERVAAGRAASQAQRSAAEQPGAASRMDPLTAALPASDAESLMDPDARGHWANRPGAKRPPPGVPPVPLWCTAGPFVPPPASSRSLVSDAFEGVMCSRVRCRTCKHESVTFDTFTDMSLSIPESPHPATDLGVKSAGAAPIDQVRRGGFASTGPRRSGWCSFGWGRALRVEDCLHDFCSPDALTGAEKYSCEKCACLREADKAFAIAKLPEVLCIQLKRFSHTTMWGKLSTRVDFPLEGLDMSPFVWSDSHLKRHGAAGELLAWGGSPAEGPFEYDLVSFVQHMGTMSGGHYIAYGKEPTEGRWRCFNDEYVTDASASTVAGQEAYILFFTRRRVAPSAPLPMAMPPADPSRDSTAVHCWVSARWWLRYRVFSCPGPITSYDVVCPHGRIRNNLLENFTDASTGRLSIFSFLVPLTEAQWAALVATFGRQGPPVYDASPCPACALEAEALAARRRAEATTISRVDSKSLPSATGDLASPTDRAAAYWHLIGTAWVRNWHSFKDNKSSADDGTFRGCLPPGPIDNSALLRANGSPKGHLQPVTHYRGVNAAVWNCFHDLYGGGPLLRRADRIDIYAPAVDPIPPDLLGTFVSSSGESAADDIVLTSSSDARKGRAGAGGGGTPATAGEPVAVAPWAGDGAASHRALH
ncbi:hypothetical protein FNF28_02165 [Cafeteria roenbergensis]|uniref:Uncharacterized protein n=2 Tax=Cafeteria roenbergensis TaxID=33653 RepID=A0A5A8DV77_CAFRO|nr:hypothetical protein FNF28_02165 [Cafeteria roenbergensis]